MIINYLIGMGGWWMCSSCTFGHVWMATEERLLGVLLLFLLISSRIEGPQAYPLLLGCIWLIWTELLFLYDLLILVKKHGVIELCLPFHWTVAFRLVGPIRQNFTSQTLVTNVTNKFWLRLPLKIETRTFFVKRLLQTLLVIHKTVEPRLVGWTNQWNCEKTIVLCITMTASFAVSVEV